MDSALLDEIASLAKKRLKATTPEVVRLWRLVKALANELLINAGFNPVGIRAMHTKFNDAGRRSAPWRAFSGRVAGRPQDGADGNRILRWLLDPKHKFYATEQEATLVQIRYYLQMLSMDGAPPLPRQDLTTCFHWLVGHDVLPGAYQDPIQLIPIPLKKFLDNPRSITSGHLIPLDRKGRHVPSNAYLMLKESNSLQGNLTMDELIELMRNIVKRHDTREVRGRRVG